MTTLNRTIAQGEIFGGGRRINLFVPGQGMTFFALTAIVAGAALGFFI